MRSVLPVAISAAWKCELPPVRRPVVQRSFGAGDVFVVPVPAAAIPPSVRDDIAAFCPLHPDADVNWGLAGIPPAQSVTGRWMIRLAKGRTRHCTQ